MRRIPCILALLLLADLGHTQQCTTYSVVAAVDRRTGDDIDDLKPEDFAARSGGKPVTVLSATQKFDNRVLILLETDGRKSDRVADAVDLVTRLARQAPEGRRLAFAVFAGKSKFTKTFSTDTKARSQEIAEVIEEAPNLGKRVALYDALHDAVKYFGQHQPGDTVMLISDAFDESSHHGASQVEEEFEKSGIRLLVMMRQPLSHVTGNFLWTPPEHDRDILERMSERTGGMYTMFGAHLFDVAWRGYMLGVEVPNGNKPRSWKVQLSDLAADTHRKSKLSYPERLPACSVDLAQAR